LLAPASVMSTPSDDAPRSSRGLAGKLVLLAALAIVVVAFFRFHGERYLTLDAVNANRDALLAFTNAHFAAALGIAFALYVLTTALSLPGALVLSLTMGFLFGRWVGTVLVVVAATIGATLVFVAARYLFADAARRRMGTLGAKINAGFTENALSYLLFLRLVPLFPFFLVNLAPAFTTIRVRTFIIGTLIGIIPGSFVFVNLGQTLGRIDSLSGLLSAETIAAFVLLGALALTPVLVRKMRAPRAEKA
jgi:uncharacterized membrane protein YdjX (TVP38/TMEM64 family)